MLPPLGSAQRLSVKGVLREMVYVVAMMSERKEVYVSTAQSLVQFYKIEALIPLKECTPLFFKHGRCLWQNSFYREPSRGHKKSVQAK